MLQLACSEARKKLNNQLSAINSVDQKIGMLLGLIGVSLALSFDNKLKIANAVLPYIIGLLLLAISALLLFFAYRCIRLKTGLNIKGYSELIEKLKNKTTLITFLKHQLLYFEDSIISNNKLIKQKNKSLAYGAITLLASLLFCIASYLM